jgi:hypothetical protein
VNGGPLLGLSGRLGALLSSLALLAAGASPALGAPPASGLAPALTSTSAPAAPVPATPAPPVVPPDLLALEQKMLALEVTSERFSGSINVDAAGERPKGPLGGFARVVARAAGVPFPLLSFSGEVSLVAPLATFQASLFGLLKVEGRLVGTTLYTNEPFIARLDGGRPWVEEANQKLEHALGLAPTNLGAKTGSGARAFSQIAQVIAHARAIRELGTETVDGVPTTVFSLTVDVAQLEGQSGPQRRASKKLGQPLADYDLYLTAAGLPVRVKVTLDFHKEHARLITQSDVLAINFPFSVQAPSASQTISMRALERVLAVVYRHRHRHPPRKAVGQK